MKISGSLGEIIEMNSDGEEEHHDRSKTPSKSAEKSRYDIFCEREAKEEIEEEREAYKSICKKLRISVVSSFLDNISRENMNLSHRGIGEHSISGIVTCLKKNTKVRFLNLTDNNLGASGAAIVGNVFLHNYTITYLNISSNHINDKIR